MRRPARTERGKTVFIDMHHHLVYGIDDGAKSFEGTEKMIRDAVENNVDTIITTPHITPGQEPFPYEDYQKHLEEIRAWLEKEKIDLKLYTGAEILYTAHTPRLLQEGRIPTMAGSQYVMLEFSPDEQYKSILDAVSQVASTGYVPILAHVERYMQIKKTAQLEKMRRECNALCQMNNSTVVHKHGFFQERWNRRLLREGLIDFVSSDSHDLPGRKNRMQRAYERLCQDLGEGIAHALTCGNARRLLLNQEE